MSATLATLLKDARTNAGLTQEQLAKKAGSQLEANDISRAERGLDVPSDTQLKAIAKVTGVTQKSLLDAARTARTKASSAAKKTTASTAKTTASKTTSAAKKTTAAAKKTTTAAKTSTAKKTTAAAKKTTAAKTTAAAKKDEYTLTATEKKLIDAYRSASSENKKLALNLLQGKDVEESDASGIGTILQNGLSSGLGGVLETLISGLGK